MVKGSQAVIGPHIGNLENLETLEYYQASLKHFAGLLELEPAIIAHDMSPDYPSTHLAH